MPIAAENIARIECASIRARIPRSVLISLALERENVNAARLSNRVRP